MENNLEPSLDDLSVFLAVCEASGFRAAAKRLGLAPSNVSDTVARLTGREPRTLDQLLAAGS